MRLLVNCEVDFFSCFYEPLSIMLWIGLVCTYKPKNSMLFTCDAILSLALVLKVKKKPAQVLVLQLVSTDESANESNFYMLEYNSL